jgi:ADP-ribosylglycohydrolase
MLRLETLIRNLEVLRAAVALSARTDHTLTQQQCTDLLKGHNLEGIKGASLWGSGRNHKFFSGKGVPPLVSKAGDHSAKGAAATRYGSSAAPAAKRYAGRSPAPRAGGPYGSGAAPAATRYAKGAAATRYAVHQRWQQAYYGWLAEPGQPKKKTKRREEESEELLPRSGRVNLLLTALEQNSSMAAALLPALEELPNMVERAVARAVKPAAEPVAAEPAPELAAEPAELAAEPAEPSAYAVSVQSVQIMVRAYQQSFMATQPLRGMNRYGDVGLRPTQGGRAAHGLKSTDKWRDEILAMAAKTPRTTRTGDLCGYHPVKDEISDALPGLYGFLAEERPDDRVLSRRIGCAVGMYVGDGQGNNKEFEPFDPAKCDDPYPMAEMLNEEKCGRFQLIVGQQTDDASMGHVLFVNYALYGHLYDLLLAKAGFLLWWARGYCNGQDRKPGFRVDAEATSVGLGGQIGSALNFNEPSAEKAFVTAPAVLPGGSTKNNGNGSLMRNAAFAALLRGPRRQRPALEVVALHSAFNSFVTHSGVAAAMEAGIMAALASQAMHDFQDDPKGLLGPANMEAVWSWLKPFFVEHLPGVQEDDLHTVACIMGSEPETVQYGPTDNLFENQSRDVRQRDRTWRTPELADVPCGKTARAQACLEYFGSLSHDAMCLALWAVWNSTCFEDAVRPLLMAGGDADTTGAIAGQLAGAVYGMHGPRGVMQACEGHWWRLARKYSLAEDAAAIVLFCNEYPYAEGAAASRYAGRSPAPRASGP